LQVVADRVALSEAPGTDGREARAKLPALKADNSFVQCFMTSNFSQFKIQQTQTHTHKHAHKQNFPEERQWGASLDKNETSPLHCVHSTVLWLEATS
jgi:hypothetical protein